MNYDEKAGKICADLRSIRSHLEGGYDEARNPIDLIASALREAAAEAYRDAAMELWGPDHGQRLINKAKALEGPTEDDIDDEHRRFIVPRPAPGERGSK